MSTLNYDRLVQFILISSFKFFKFKFNYISTKKFERKNWCLFRKTNHLTSTICSSINSLVTIDSSQPSIKKYVNVCSIEEDYSSFKVKYILLLERNYEYFDRLFMVYSRKQLTRGNCKCSF